MHNIIGCVCFIEIASGCHRKKKWHTRTDKNDVLRSRHCGIQLDNLPELRFIWTTTTTRSTNNWLLCHGGGCEPHRRLLRAAFSGSIYWRRKHIAREAWRAKQSPATCVCLCVSVFTRHLAPCYGAAAGGGSMGSFDVEQLFSASTAAAGLFGQSLEDMTRRFFSSPLKNVLILS